MATRSARILAGLLILGTALIAAPVHAAPLGTISPVAIPLYPTILPGHPTITMQTPGPSSNSFYVNGSGFSRGGDVRIYTFSATYQLQNTWSLSASSVTRYCPTLTCAGTFHAYIFTDPCQQTVNDIAYDVSTGEWSNWVRGYVSCIGAP